MSGGCTPLTAWRWASRNKLYFLQVSEALSQGSELNLGETIDLQLCGGVSAFTRVCSGVHGFSLDVCYVKKRLPTFGTHVAKNSNTEYRVRHTHTVHRAQESQCHGGFNIPALPQDRVLAITSVIYYFYTHDGFLKVQVSNLRSKVYLGRRCCLK